jgi:hypothetical protein
MTVQSASSGHDIVADPRLSEPSCGELSQPDDSLGRSAIAALAVAVSAIGSAPELDGLERRRLVMLLSFALLALTDRCRPKRPSVHHVLRLCRGRR